MGILEKPNGICYNASRQMNEVFQNDTQTKTLSSRNTEGFLFRFGKVAYALG